MKTQRIGEKSRRRASALGGRRPKGKSRKRAKLPVLSWAEWLEKSFHQAAPMEWLPTSYQALLKSQKPLPKSKRALH